MAKYKRKGCGPRGLGVSPLKSGRAYVFDEDNLSSVFKWPEGSKPNDYARIYAYDQVDVMAPVNQNPDGTRKDYRNMKVTKKVGSFNVPTAGEKSFTDDINKDVSAGTMIPYERGQYFTPISTSEKIKSSEPKRSTKTTTEKTKPSGKVAYGGTKTWAEGSKAAKASTGKSLNQLVAARKGLKKGSAEYNTIQNQINTSLGSKKRHGTPAKKKGRGKNRK